MHVSRVIGMVRIDRYCLDYHCGCEMTPLTITLIIIATIAVTLGLVWLWFYIVAGQVVDKVFSDKGEK